MSNPHDDFPKTPVEMINRVCRLFYDVHEARNGYADPCDCFCPREDGRFSQSSYWRTDADTLAFVEKAVREALAAEKKAKPCPTATEHPRSDTPPK